MTKQEFSKKTYRFFKEKLTFLLPPAELEDEHFFIQEEICAICVEVMTEKQRDKAFKLCVKHFKEQDKKYKEEMERGFP